MGENEKKLKVKTMKRCKSSPNPPRFDLKTAKNIYDQHYQQKRRYRDLAQSYRCSTSTVWAICNKKSPYRSL